MYPQPGNKLINCQIVEQVYCQTMASQWLSRKVAAAVIFETGRFDNI